MTEMGKLAEQRPPAGAVVRGGLGHLHWGGDILRQRWMIRHHRLRRLTLDMLIEKRSSDTLFVLGSGASVCQYSHDQWATIGMADSIGMNNWILHDFVPTFYAAELIADESWLQTYSSNLIRRLPEYGHTLIILRWVTSWSSVLMLTPTSEAAIS